MAKLSNTRFRTLHAVRYCIVLEFREFLTLKKRSRDKPAFEDGSLLPTPNSVTAAWMARRLKGDFAVESRPEGIIQCVMIADESEAVALARDLKLEFSPGDGRQWTFVTRHVVSAFTQLKWAREAALL